VVVQSGDDTTLDAWYPTDTWGTDTRTRVRQGNIASALVRFNPITLPPMAAVTSAKLRLYVASQTSTRSLALRAYRVRRSWDETTATWQRASASQLWTVPGCGAVPADRESAVIGSAPIPARGSWLEMDVTSAVRSWMAAPGQNYGLLLKGEGTVSVAYYFASFEYASTALRPMLVIDYVVQPFGPTLTPTRSATPKYTPTPTATRTPAPGSVSWTFMLYMDGDNDLTPYMERKVRDLEALPANANVRVVVLFDGLGTNYTWRFVVQPGGNYTLGVNRWFMGELNMGAPQTLSDFVTWTRANYPAEHYYLAIGNHGRGTTGIAFDDSNGRDYLTPGELRAALNTATRSGQWKIDVLHYDACLMGLLEQAYEIKEFADYWVAYENLGWGVFCYDRYVNVASGPFPGATREAGQPRLANAEELASGVAEAYFSHPSILNSARTVSAIDLSRIGPVYEAVDSLAAALLAHWPAIKPQVAAARAATQKFDSQDYMRITQQDEYVDLYDLARQLKLNVNIATVQGAAQAVMDAIDAGFVVAERHYSWPGPDWGLENAHGIAIYFPPTWVFADYGLYVTGRLFTFTVGNQWDEFLQAYLGTRGAPSAPGGDQGRPPMLIP
jgi:hypothetical protein